MMNKIKEHGFVKDLSCQPNLISFFDKATGVLHDGEAENTSEAFCIFPLDSLKQGEKTPSKNNQSSTGRVTAPEEERSRQKEVSPAATMALEEGLSTFPSRQLMGHTAAFLQFGSPQLCPRTAPCPRKTETKPLLC